MGAEPGSTEPRLALGLGRDKGRGPIELEGGGGAGAGPQQARLGESGRLSGPWCFLAQVLSSKCHRDFPWGFQGWPSSPASAHVSVAMSR